MSPELHQGFSDLWRSPSALSSTLTLRLPIFFFFWMLRHPVFWYTTFFLTQSVRSPLVTYPSLCSPCVTYRMWCHASSHQVLPTEPSPRETEDFPWCGNHSKHVSLLTCLAWLQPIYYNPKFVFMHVKTGKALLVVKTSIKNM